MLKNIQTTLERLQNRIQVRFQNPTPRDEGAPRGDEFLGAEYPEGGASAGGGDGIGPHLTPPRAFLKEIRTNNEPTGRACLRARAGGSAPLRVASLTREQPRQGGGATRRKKRREKIASDLHVYSKNTLPQNIRETVLFTGRSNARSTLPEHNYFGLQPIKPMREMLPYEPEASRPMGGEGPEVLDRRRYVCLGMPPTSAPPPKGRGGGRDGHGTGPDRGRFYPKPPRRRPPSSLSPAGRCGKGDQRVGGGQAQKLHTVVRWWAFRHSNHTLGYAPGILPPAH